MCDSDNEWYRYWSRWPKKRFIILKLHIAFAQQIWKKKDALVAGRYIWIVCELNRGSYHKCDKLKPHTCAHTVASVNDWRWHQCKQRQRTISAHQSTRPAVHKLVHSIIKLCVWVLDAWVLISVRAARSIGAKVALTTTDTVSHPVKTPHQSFEMARH